MKKVILPIALIAFSIANQVSAQSSRAFAITSEGKGSFNWTVVKEINLTTGSTVKTIYQPADNKQVTVFGASTNNIPTFGGVAAAAYDAKHNRLYFSQMRENELRYFDLNSAETKVIANNDRNYSTGTHTEEANNITRMTFAADGFGYALTNDGNSLIRFTTSDKPTITNLGSLYDSKKNNNISVHTQCTSWGGDLIGDVYGNLYLLTFRNNIFKINTRTLEAEFIGGIKGLPVDFTTNGAAVDFDGNVLIASATKTDNYYKLNLSTLEATVIEGKSNDLFSTSDLASSNLAFQKSAAPVIALLENTSNDAVSIYPNPAVNRTFAVQFNSLPAGKYNIEVATANGARVLSKAVTVNGTQSEKITLPKGTNSGLMLVRIVNADGKSVSVNKVIVE